MTILQSFPVHLKPRPIQKHTLEALQRHWNDAKIFVVSLPTASGKSAISTTIANWKNSAAIITPSKLLVDQYAAEYPYLTVIRGKSDFWCDTFNCPVSVRPQSTKAGKLCKADWPCSGCRKYRKQIIRTKTKPIVIANYFTYMAHRLYRDVLIVDEAHQLIPTIKALAAKKFWHHKYRIPSYIKSREHLTKWINNLPADAFHRSYTLKDPEGKGRYMKAGNGLRWLQEELNSKRPSYLVTITEDKYHGETVPVVSCEPLDVRDAPPFIWPDKVKKIVLLSATISRKDIEQLGLADQRIQYIEAESPIMARQRPVVLPTEAKSMGYKVQDQNLPALAAYIRDCADSHPEEKGLIHATYSLADKLRRELKGDPRFIFHDRDTKSEVYKRFRDMEEPGILVASGMYEGIDLPYDAGRWQIIAKIPWPNLGDPAISYLTNLDPEYYNWETIKTTLQACGRICRTPTDHGVTYVFDKSFERLYDTARPFFPKWFQQSVRKGK